MITRKPGSALTLHDRLSQLSFEGACKLLGAPGAALIRKGGTLEVDLTEQVSITAERFVFRVPQPRRRPAEVAMWLADDRARRLRWRCSACTGACEHVGAALSVVLEDKVALGLAEPPLELGTDTRDLVVRAIEERVERARTEKMALRSADPATPWADYTITSAVSGKSYRVALRSEGRGDSYCSCPDFRKNTLGTCKHILHVLDKVRRRFPAAARRKPYVRTEISVHLRYGEEAELRIAVPAVLPRAASALLASMVDRAISDVHDLVRCIARLERLGHAVTIYPDAEEYIQSRLFRDRIRAKVDEIRADPVGHPLRRSLLRAELLPYQLDGIAFATGAGRAVLADDMGLGKTIQAIGVAELLAREAEIRKVLVVCPASVKAQWCTEIERFSHRSCQIVLGSMPDRGAQYASDTFFSICNYEQVLRDLRAIERAPWDLIVLDEGQRIKNWEAKTSDVIKRLRSRFALVLSGTPLENRLDELYSVVEFIDDRRLGPAFRFFDRHRVVDDKGKVLGYQRLDELRTRLAPVLLRRTRESVAQQLPPRTTEVVRIAPTGEQLEIHDANMRTVAQIVRKPYLTEMDLLRLRKALLLCRMAADSTFLVDKRTPAYSSKLRELEVLLVRLCAEGRKIVLFSEWTTMLDLIERVLRANQLRWVRLDGSVPQKKRQQIVHEFQRDPECRLFLTTNAGSTGLNLQAADTIVNVDLPWNPAVLEQRIGRAHRMGQKRPVHAFVLVTEGTIEENLLTTLAAKRELALAALDPSSDVDRVDLVGSMDELKRRLEVLLGAKPDAPVDDSERARNELEAQSNANRKQRVAEASGQLVAAAFRLLNELLPPREDTPALIHAGAVVREQLAAAVDTDPAGRPVLTLTLPDRAALDGIAHTLGALLAHGPAAAVDLN
ncbi:MAG TPA: DEAD/DEAH box helicase [Kofleriaceae bacterium]|nr:DEAD/DEAH box helicase [Kofleriaceae bacterium]